MEQKEMIGLLELPELQIAAPENGKTEQSDHHADAIKVVIYSDNYRIEIEIA